MGFQNHGMRSNAALRDALADALLMTILPQTFLTLVGRHFMALTLLSAWHSTL
jgi:hypothetical protein